MKDEPQVGELYAVEVGERTGNRVGGRNRGYLSEIHCEHRISLSERLENRPVILKKTQQNYLEIFDRRNASKRYLSFFSIS